MAKRNRRAKNQGLRASVLGMPIDKLDMIGALHTVEAFINQGGPHQVITANAEIFYRASNDLDMKRIIQRADMVLADGAGLVWAADFLGDPVPERVAGIDLLVNIAELSARGSYKVFLLGGAPGIADKAANELVKRYPTLEIVGTHHGFFSGEDEDELINTIRLAGTQILFVALGAPRAEKWISANAKKLAIPVMMGVGGSLDVISGVSKRAPKWMQKSGFEWLYRLVRQPSRIGRMAALPRFVLRVVSSKLSGNGDKH